MALVECWECGKEVSQGAETCPHCGIKSPAWRPPVKGITPPGSGAGENAFSAENPKSKSNKVITGIAVMVFSCIVFTICGSLVGDDEGSSRTSAPRPPTATPGPTPTFTPTPTWQQWKDTAVEMSYAELFRYAEKHVGKLVHFRGEVVQVQERRGDFKLRVLVTSEKLGNSEFWSDAVYLHYDDAPVRVLEKDIVSFVAEMLGTKTYSAVLGNTVTIPELRVKSLQIENE